METFRSDNKQNTHHHVTFSLHHALFQRQRTYRLFRTLGLRFLCVVNHNNQVVGIITRCDLLPEALSDSIMRGRNAHMQGVHHLT